MRQADIDDRRVEPLHDAGADDRRGSEPAMRHRRRLRALAPDRRELWMAGPVMTVFIQPTATADAYSLRRAPERKPERLVQKSSKCQRSQAGVPVWRVSA